MLHSPKQHIVLKVLTENKVFYFSKRPLHVRTARNICLKKRCVYSTEIEIVNFLIKSINTAHCGFGHIG